MSIFPPGRADLTAAPGVAATVVDPLLVTRAVVAAQMVFTVGHVLTTGAFLQFFAHALGPTALMFSVLLVTPEISEALAVFTRPVVRRLGGRKRTWLAAFILARLAALGIPAMAVSAWRPDDRTAFWILVASLGVMHVFQSIAYTAYISWLSDLAPRSNWGSFFALRRIANVAVLVLLPAAVALLRRNWTDWLTDDGVRRAYLAVFAVGNVCLWLTILPLLRLPDRPVQWSAGRERGLLESAADCWRSRPLRWVLACNLWLAVAQGLTQSAFFRYQVGVLRLPLEAYLALSALMYLLQIPWSWLGGWLSDSCGDRRPLIAGLLLVSGAMAFWLLARPGAAYWLIGAYAVWGLFGLVNVNLRNLLLRTAPPSDNTLPIAALEHVAGLCAGLAGLLGGYALDRLVDAFGTGDLRPYTILFILSWLGRASAAAFLLPATETRRASPDPIRTAGDPTVIHTAS